MRILTSESMSMCDRRSMDDQKVDEIYLVNKAARACFDNLRDKINHDSKIIVVCGNSNNSSDGFCLTDILIKKGYYAKALYLFDKSKMNKTCGHFYKDELVTRELGNPDVIIDCVIGNGLKGTLREDVVELINLLNNTKAYKIAIDLPTGLNSNTGNYDPVCFKADLTIAINNIKIGHLLNR